MHLSMKTIDEDDLTTERSKEHYTLDDWKKSWYAKMGKHCVFISALNKDNLDDFKKMVF